VASVVRELLTDKEVEKEGTEFLSRLFTHAQTHEAGVILLKNVLNDSRFVEEGKMFGVDLISGVIRSPICEEDFKNIVIKTLEDESVKKQTVEILRYIVSQKDSEDILALYFKTVFLRDDLLHGLTALLTRSALLTLDSDHTRDKFGQFLLRIASNEQVKGALFDNYLYKPARRFFSFGILRGEGNGNNSNNNS
jgi:hypothetical protein